MPQPKKPPPAKHRDSKVPLVCTTFLGGVLGAAGFVTLQKLDGRPIVPALLVGVVFGGLSARTGFEILHGTGVNYRAAIALVPPAVAVLTYVVAKLAFSNPAVDGHAHLEHFFETSVGLLAILLIPVALNTSDLVASDEWLRVVRDWWFFYIVVGIVAGLVGLTPEQSVRTQDTAYRLVLSGIGGALAAVGIIMWKSKSANSSAV